MAGGVGKVRMPVDMSTGHPPFPPTNPAQGSLTKFTDQFPQVRVGDAWVPHCSPAGCHTPVTAMGSTTVFSDQLPTHRMTDALSCGDRSATGSITAFGGA